eukprot:TRINITY_DN57897_c0_g1_i1.p1 TRINITY_DN57897_c0_g1~~TRINITY_DN57897_c0_g1_i1.p1  ORF type:complete len:342 (+),score=73.90 TRINITY_DN57897_c0_g1_i1:51-1076(+)
MPGEMKGASALRRSVGRQGGKGRGAAFRADGSEIDKSGEVIERSEALSPGAVLKLPTPSRGGRNLPAVDSTQPASLTAAAAPQWPAAHTAAQHQQQPPVPPSNVRGPEPWALPSESAASGIPEVRTNYRERLQARGQQAMNRSLGASSPVPLPASPAATVPGVSHGPLAGLLGSVPPLPQPAPPPAWVADVQPPWFAPPTPEAQPPLMIPGLCRQGSLGTDCLGQQSPHGDGYQMMRCGQGMMSPHTGSSESTAASPMGAAFGMGSFGQPLQMMPDQVPAQMMQHQQLISPQNAQPIQSPHQLGSMSHDQMMAAMLPWSLGMDNEHLAAQLKAAANCCYED